MVLKYKNHIYKHGDPISGIIKTNLGETIDVSGKLYIQNSNTFYFCQNKVEGAPAPDKLGYDYSWQFGLLNANNLSSGVVLLPPKESTIVSYTYEIVEETKKAEVFTIRFNEINFGIKVILTSLGPIHGCCNINILFDGDYSLFELSPEKEQKEFISTINSIIPNTTLVAAVYDKSNFNDFLEYFMGFYRVCSSKQEEPINYLIRRNGKY